MKKKFQPIYILYASYILQAYFEKILIKIF